MRLETDTEELTEEIKYNLRVTDTSAEKLDRGQRDNKLWAFKSALYIREKSFLECDPRFGLNDAIAGSRITLLPGGAQRHEDGAVLER